MLRSVSLLEIVSPLSRRVNLFSSPAVVLLERLTGEHSVMLVFEVRFECFTHLVLDVLILLVPVECRSHSVSGARRYRTVTFAVDHVRPPPPLTDGREFFEFRLPRPDPELPRPSRTAESTVQTTC